MLFILILDKFSEDAMARHSRNMKNKITTPRGKSKMAPSPARGNNTARPSTMSMSGKNISNVNNGMGSTTKNFGSTNQKSTKPVLRMKEIKNKIIDHQRLLEDQILEDRRRKESAKEKEEEDELSFMKAMKGSNYGNNNYSNNNNNYDNNNYNNNNNEDQFQSDFSINTDRNYNNNNNNNYNNGYGSKKSSPGKFGSFNSKFDNTENNGSFSSRFGGGSDFNNDSPQSRAQTAAHQPKFNSLATVASGSLNGGVPITNGRDRSNNFQDKNNYGNLRYLDTHIFFFDKLHTAFSAFFFISILSFLFSDTLSLSIYVSLALSLSPFVSLSVAISLSLSLSPTLSLSPSRTHSLSLSLSLLLYLSISLYPSLSIHLSLSLSLSNIYTYICIMIRRAATPGGALECETQMTDSNTTLMVSDSYHYRFYYHFYS